MAQNDLSELTELLNKMNASTHCHQVWTCEGQPVATAAELPSGPGQAVWLEAALATREWVR